MTKREGRKPSANQQGSPETEVFRMLTLDFSNSRTIRDKYMFLSQSGVFSMADLTKTLLSLSALMVPLYSKSAP